MESSSKSQLELGLGCKSLELSLEHGRPEAGSAEHTVPRAQSREGSAKALEERSLTISFLALGFPSLQGQFQTCLLQNPSSEIAGTMTTRSKQLLLLPLTGARAGPAQHLAHGHFGSALLGLPCCLQETEAQIQVPGQAHGACTLQPAGLPLLWPPHHGPRVPPPTQSSLECPTQGDSQLGPSSQVA